MAVNLDTNSIYSSYFTQTKDTLSASNASSLESSLNGISKDMNDEDLMEACKSFETYFVKLVYQEMEKTVEKEEEENEYLSYFGDTLMEEYAKATTESGSLGLAQKLYQSIKNNG